MKSVRKLTVLEPAHAFTSKAELTTAPAGTIFITTYSILHRRAASTHMPYTRNLREHPWLCRLPDPQQRRA